MQKVIQGKKLQRAGAVQDAPRFWEIDVLRAASWTAVVLYRFPSATANCSNVN